jgi:cell division septation protein DedD
MLQEGVIEGRPGDDDPGAIALLRKLSTNQRKRWPETAVSGPQLIPPPTPKPAAADAPKPPEPQPTPAPA